MKPNKCGMCYGQGTIEDAARDTQFRTSEYYLRCEDCNGSGVIVGRPVHSLPFVDGTQFTGILADGVRVVCTLNLAADYERPVLTAPSGARVFWSELAGWEPLTNPST